MNSAARELHRTPGHPDNSQEMLPQQPPPRVLLLMAWLIIALFLVGIFVAVTVQFPETVHCQFVLISEQGTDPIQSRLMAVVHQVNVSEGQEVEEGATLFLLRSDEIRSWQTQLQTANEDFRALRDRAKKLDEFFDSQMDIKDQEIQQIEREVVFRARHAATRKNFLERNQKLADEKLISDVDMLSHQLALEESEKDWQVAQRTQQQITLQRHQLETERARQKMDEQSELEKLKFRMEALQRQLENCQGDVMSVRAPYRAVVISLGQRNAGSVVLNGQELCQLARVDSRPFARLTIQEGGLPRLAVGQRVRLFLNAFPYQRYGTQSGKLDWISPATVNSPAGQRFIARASLDQPTIGDPGMTKPLRVGMEGEARIVVGGRTLIEFAFEPLRQLREQSGK